MTAAAAEGERVTASALLADLLALGERVLRILDAAEKAKDYPLALRAVAECRNLIAVGMKGVETTELEKRFAALDLRLQQQRRA